MKKIIKPAFEDPCNSVDLFDSDRENDFGEMFCIAPSILSSQIDFEWKQYVDNQIAALRNRSSGTGWR